MRNIKVSKPETKSSSDGAVRDVLVYRSTAPPTPACGCRAYISLVIYTHTLEPNLRTLKYFGGEIELGNYNKKIVKCGNLIQIYTFENAVPHGFSKVRIGELGSDDCEYIVEGELYDKLTEEEKQRNAEKREARLQSKVKSNEPYQRAPQTISRCKRELKRLIWSNICQYDTEDKFITLTFRDINGKPPTREQVIYKFKQFKKQYKRKKGESFEHIAVLERGTQFTKRWHIHLIAYGMPYIPKRELQDIWGNGIVDIEKVKTYDETINYLLKYVEKTLEEEYITKGAKFYLSSKGLKRPEIIFISDEQLEDILLFDDLGECRCNFEGANEYIGRFWFNEYINYDNINAHLDKLWDMQPTVELQSKFERKPVDWFV